MIILSKEQRKQTRKFCKAFSVKVSFANMDIGGEAHCTENRIILDNRYYCEDSYWSAVCHEICHVLAYRDHKYYAYHANLNTPEVKNNIKTAYKAEKYVDRMGRDLMRAYLPDMKYNWTYHTNASRIWLNDYLRSLNKYY